MFLKGLLKLIEQPKSADPALLYTHDSLDIGCYIW